jgi:hypothetical protein
MQPDPARHIAKSEHRLMAAAPNVTFPQKRREI